MSFRPDVWTAANDGSGSNLDADKLDNLSSADFELALGNPGTDGFHLVSTAAGARSWEAVPSGGSAYVLFRRDGFSALTARETFHLSGGTNITIAASDDAGNDETDITINAVIALNDLSDVDVSPIDNRILQYSTGNTTWQDVTIANAGISELGHTHTASEVTDFSTEVDVRIGLAPLEDLADVTITTIGTGELLQWNGSAWINQTFTELALVRTTVINTFTADQILSSPTPQIRYKLSSVPSGAVSMGPSFTDSAGTEKFRFAFDNTDLFLQFNNGGWDDRIKYAIGAGRMEFQQRPAAFGAGSGGVASGLVVFSTDDLDIFSAVTLTAIADGELLKWNGTIWINQTLAEAGISAPGHTHLEADVTDLQAYLLDITGEPLSDLSDVTIASIGSGELLKWNGSAWVNNTLVEAGIPDITATTVVTGAWNFTTATLKIGGSAGSPDLEITDDSARDPRLKAPGGKMTLETLGSTTATGDGLYLDDGGTTNAKVVGIKLITNSTNTPTGDYPYGTLHLIY